MAFYFVKPFLSFPPELGPFCAPDRKLLRSVNFALALPYKIGKFDNPYRLPCFPRQKHRLEPVESFLIWMNITQKVYLNILENLVALSCHIIFQKRFLPTTVPEVQNHVPKKSKNINIKISSIM